MGSDLVHVHVHPRCGVDDWLGPMKQIIDNPSPPYGFPIYAVRCPRQDFIFPLSMCADIAPRGPDTELYARQSRSPVRRYRTGMPALHPTKGYRRSHKNFRGGSR